MSEEACSVSIGVTGSVDGEGDTQPLQMEPKAERGSERVEGGLALEVSEEVSRLNCWGLVGWEAGSVGGSGAFAEFVGLVEGAEVGVGVGVGVAMMGFEKDEVGR